MNPPVTVLRRACRCFTAASATIAVIAAALAFAVLAPVTGAAAEEAAAAAAAVTEAVAEAAAVADAAAAPVSPDAADAAEPADAVAEALPLELEVQVRSVQENHNINFNENGERQNENHQLSLQMVLKLDPEHPVLGYRDMRVERVITSAAEQLRSMNNNGRSSNLHNVFGQPQPQQQVSLYAQLVAPQRPAQRLQEVAGRLTLLMGVGPVREALLGPFEKVDGKHATIQGIPGSSLKLTSRNNRLRLELNSDLRNQLDRLRLVDGRGVDIPVQSWGSGGNGHNGMQYLELRTPPAPGMTVVLQLFDHVQEREGVFTVTDVPLPVPEPAEDAGGGLVLELHPLGEGVVEGGGVAAEPLPRLPVVVED